MKAAAAAPVLDLALVWTNVRSFFRGMIGIEIAMPALLILAGIVTLLASPDPAVRSFGLALLLPGLALAIGSAIRIIGMVGAQRAFLGSGRQAALRRGRRLAMISLPVGVVAAIASLVIISTISWVSEGGGVIAILLVVFVFILTLGLAVTEFRAEATAAEATKSFV